MVYFPKPRQVGGLRRSEPIDFTKMRNELKRKSLDAFLEGLHGPFEGDFDDDSE